MVIWCPDWPVVTALKQAKLPGTTAAAVFSGNRVKACTATARAEGVAIGQRRREAQSRCPGLEVLHLDKDRDARVFEPVAALIESLAPGVEILRPGLVGCPARGPSRYFGSETRAAEQIVDAIESLDVECRVGVADSLEVAVLAARRSTIVPTGRSASFCADLPIGELAGESSIAAPERPELVDLLVRLGITTLGAFAAIPMVKVATRFGADAVAAHRLAAGEGERTVSRRHIPADLTIEQVCDPPLERVDTAAFAARVLAERFHSRLAEAGLACTRLTISARTELGKQLSRTWRCTQPLTPAATADRLRWQLDGWLTSSRTYAADSPGAITMLRLEPIEAVGAGFIQFGLWGSEGESDQKAGWALARVQGLLGPESVLAPAKSGGRSPIQRIELVPWGQEPAITSDPAAPWPGRIPAPSPSRLLTAAVHGDQVALRDARRSDITVTDRGMLSAEPRWCVVAAGRGTQVAGWAGPWVLDERWWARPPGAPVTRARLQLCLAEGAPLLLAFGEQGWTIEGVYD